MLLTEIQHPFMTAQSGVKEMCSSAAQAVHEGPAAGGVLRCGMLKGSHHFSAVQFEES